MLGRLPLLLDQRVRPRRSPRRRQRPHASACAAWTIWPTRWRCSGTEPAGLPIFCFHDDNFLLPRPDATLARLHALRVALDDRGVGKIALVGKCRPETVTPDLARELAGLGVIRLYVGVENASVAGGRHLGRAVQTAARRGRHHRLPPGRHQRLLQPAGLRAATPRSTTLRANIVFIRAHAENPVNFCRAEPYVGTPLHAALRAAGRLEGDHLAWGSMRARSRTARMVPPADLTLGRSTVPGPPIPRPGASTARAGSPSSRRRPTRRRPRPTAASCRRRFAIRCPRIPASRLARPPRASRSPATSAKPPPASCAPRTFPSGLRRSSTSPPRPRARGCASAWSAPLRPSARAGKATASSRAAAARCSGARSTAPRTCAWPCAPPVA